MAVDRVAFGRLGTGQLEQGGEQVGDIGNLWQESVGRNAQALLMGVLRIGLGPSRDEGHAHAAFVMRPFLAAQWCRAGDRVLVPERGVRAVVTEEDHQRVFRHTKFFKMIEHVIERFVHAGNQCGKGLGALGLA